MPVIPAPWETEVGGSQGQEFKTSLAKMVKNLSLLKIQKLVCEVAGTCSLCYRGSEAGELLESKRQRLQ